MTQHQIRRDTQRRNWQFAPISTLHPHMIKRGKVARVRALQVRL